MDASLAQTADLTCPHCQQAFTAEVWLIVDAAARPDLLERARQGALHTFACPHCGEVAAELDAPLLLYRPGRSPVLLFSPAERTTSEQDQEHAQGLVGLLRDGLGGDWRDEWVAEGLRGTPRRMLPFALAEDPQAALRQTLEEAERALEELRERDPEAYSQLQRAAEEALAEEGEAPDDDQAEPGADRAEEEEEEQPELPPLMRALRDFIQAGTWTASQRMVEEHPELLSDEADEQMEALIARAEQQGNADVVRVLNEHHDLLRRCREVGVARAFAEKVGVSEERLATMRSADELPPQVREILDEIAASGAQVRSPEDLERLLADRPDLAERLMAAAHPESGDSRVPPAFESDLHVADEAEKRYQRIGDQAALDAAVAAWERILEHPAFEEAPAQFRLVAWNDAGGVYLRSYWAHGRLPDLNRALALWEQAREATPADSPALPLLLDNTANGLRARYAHSGCLEDLEGAIRISQQAVEAVSSDSHDLPMLLNTWGANLSARYAHSGWPEDLEDAIRVYQRAMEAMPADSPDLPFVLNNLGGVLRARYARSGRLEDIDDAIHAWDRAVECIPADSPDRPGYLNNLGVGLRDRYARSGRADDLEGAIRVWRRAVERIPAGAPILPMILTNLGNGLGARYAHSRCAEDLEGAIRACQQAVEATPLNSPDWPGYLNNLGICLSSRYVRNRRAEDLEGAIRAWEQAVEATAGDSPNLPGYLNNLGNGLRDRYACCKRLQDLEEAQAAYRRACLRGQEVAEEGSVQSARNWGNWALERGAWAEAAEAYGYGLAAMDRLLAAQLLRAEKETWLREVREIPARAAYALARDGKPEQAVVVMEAGRARLLAEALEQTRADLERLPALGHGDLLERYRRAAEQVRALQQQASPGTAGLQSRSSWAGGDRPGPSISQGPAPIQMLRAAQGELDRAIEAIRQVPGYEDFFRAPTVERIALAATIDAPLVYLLATTAGGLALLVSREPGAEGGARVQAVWLDDLTEPAVRELLTGPAGDPALGGYLGAYDAWRRDPTDHDARGVWFDALDRATRRLWEMAMGPLLAALNPDGGKKIGAAVLVPAGLLGLLPLHAAWTEDAARPTGRRYALDEIVLSYAPSARALARAREIAAAAPDGALLAVEEPRPVSASAIPNSAAEVAAIAFLFACPQVMRHEEAAKSAVLEALPAARVVHFSCHGATDWQNPLQSGLLMAGDEMLTVGDLLDKHLPGARLAALSACETGVVGTNLPDEVVALPSAFTQAGFAGVAASLWSVADASTAMLMERFYRLWREDGLAPAQALREAQQWMRDSTNREKGAYFKRDVPALSAGRAPADVAAGFFNRVMSRRLEARDYAHPFWWAAFYLTGV